MRQSHQRVGAASLLGFLQQREAGGGYVERSEGVGHWAARLTEEEKTSIFDGKTRIISDERGVRFGAAISPEGP